MSTSIPKYDPMLDCDPEQLGALAISYNALIACPECDLLQRYRAIPIAGVARCPRCDFILYREIPNSIDHALAFALAGLVLFVVGCAFPLLSLRFGSNVVEATLLTGIGELWSQGLAGVSALVLLTCIVAPVTHVVLILYVCVPLKFGRRPWRVDFALRSLKALQPWSMIEVFMLGVLVSMVKLAKMATILPGLGLWAFAGAIIALVAAMAVLELRTVWNKLALCR